jgi:hypothetical protein
MILITSPEVFAHLLSLRDSLFCRILVTDEAHTAVVQLDHSPGWRVEDVSTTYRLDEVGWENY